MDIEVEGIKLKTKGKKAYLQKDIFVELKPRLRRRKCLGAALLEDEKYGKELPVKPQIYNFISNEIWYYISEYVTPEEVQTFALICRQTAALVKTRKFWKSLYKQYCQQLKGVKWNHKLPERLQADNLLGCDMWSLRVLVIKSLFYCYSPLVERIKCGYTLDFLLGQMYVASWHKQYECTWVMCYKFGNKLSRNGYVLRNSIEAIEVCEEINDWESLADKNIPEPTNISYDTHESGHLLLIHCDRFIPFVNELSYGVGEKRLRLVAIRQMLSKDMRGTNLEMDFMDIVNSDVLTVTYPKLLKCKILPWWHPEFEKYIQ